MAKLTDLPPELLREIAIQLAPSPGPGYLRKVKDLKPFCMVNNLLMNVGYSILYGDIGVKVSSNAHAIIVLRSPRILMHMRELHWDRTEVYRKSDLTRDTDLLKAILRAAEQLAKLSIHYEGNERNFEPDLRISVPPEEQFLLPSLRTITTTRCVSPQELLRCFPCVQTAEFKRMLPEDDALVAVGGLQGSHITDLTISVERLSVRFLEDVGKLANLVYLQLTTCVPHRHPWSNNKEDLSPRALGERLAGLLRPLRVLKELSTSIAVGFKKDDTNYKSRGKGDEQELARKRSEAALPLARALPLLESISWMHVWCGKSGDYLYYNTKKCWGTVSRDGRSVSVLF